MSGHIVMFEALKDLCINNRNYFKDMEDENSLRLSSGFAALLDHIDSIKLLSEEFREVLSNYDYSSSVPGNGFRSFVQVVDKFTIRCTKICKEVCENRRSIFFKKSRYVKEVELSGQIFASLVSCFQLLQLIRSSVNPEDGLFLQDHEKIREFMTGVDSVNLYCFYGRFVGFQFCESIQPWLKAISVLMAVFSELWYGENGIATRTARWSNYLMDPEARALQIVKVSSYKNASVNFFKEFWSLSETRLFSKLGMFSSIAVNKVILINPEPLKYKVSEEKFLDIAVPSSHIGQKPLPVRLLSAFKREGMVEGGQLEPLSDYLIFHCHGGGFVAQTSGSHQTYLNQWANITGVPILSVDYSLAPESPFPRATEEVLFAYVWALNNTNQLGSTAKRVIFAGDSAGANLCLGLALKCAKLGIRKPDGLFMAYVPIVMSFTPTPARILSLLDPLLPFGFMVSCVRAYSCPGCVKTSPVKDGETILKALIMKDDNDKSDNSLVERLMELKVDGDDGHVSSGTDGSSCIKNNEVNDSKWNENFQAKLKNATDSFISSITSKINHVSGFSSSENIKTPTSYINEQCDESCINDLLTNIPYDPYLSPFIADDKLFTQLPSVSIVSVQMDPCLDDCVILAKKLKKLGKDVTLDILDGLPHGFLNLRVVSKEADEGVKLCALRLKELLKLS